MQTTSAAFTAEEKDATRKIATSALISWKKQKLSSYRPFTIGVSAIGGTDAIASSGAVVSLWNQYKYFNESTYLQHLSYERGLKFPTGGLTSAMFDLTLSNVDGRFTPRYMGGNSELFTSNYQVSRPVIINAGFNYNGGDQTIPQMVGLTSKTPKLDIRNKTMQLQGYDFVSYIQNSYADTQIMFTGQRTDQVLGTMLSTLGFSTAQYKLDTGVNIIPVAFFDIGTKYSEAINQLVEAENGQFYQDEFGVLRFENRTHYTNSPYTTVQKVITTSMVIDQMAPNTDHLVNTVEVSGSPLLKQANQLIYQVNSLSVPLIAANGNTDIWINFSDPVLDFSTPTGVANTTGLSYFVANTLADGTGTDATSRISVKAIAKFATSTKITFSNSGAAAYLSTLNLWGRPAQRTTGSNIYYRTQLGSSVTAYQEQDLQINNDFIQSPTWAQSYGQMIVNDFGRPDNLQTITVRAMPDLQLGDLVSWQGRYWRVFDIKTTIDPSVGFIQELTMLQRTTQTYFRIGISTIGGSDKIAP